MSITEKLEISREINSRNAKHINAWKGEMAMQTYITDNYRVIIEKVGDRIWIKTQQKADITSYPWEILPDGWRDCIMETASTMEDAIKKYDAQIANERRWH